MRKARGGLLALLLLSAAAAFALGAAPEPTVLLDEWHALYVNGSKSGHEHILTRELAEGAEPLYETTIQQDLSLRRGPVTIRMLIDKVIVEDAAGRIVRFTNRVRQGPIEQVSAGELRDGKLAVTMGVAPAQQSRVIERPEGLCPWALNGLRAEKGFEPGTTYSTMAFAPEFLADPNVATATVGGVEEVRVGGRSLALHRLDYAFSAMPGLPVTEWVDDANVAWLSRATLGSAMQLEFVLTSREEAVAPDAPPDILLHAFVKPDVPIAEPRGAEEMTVLLEPVEQGVELPDVPAEDPWQQVQRTEQGLRVTVRGARPPVQSYLLPYVGAEYAELLKPNQWMETGDPAVADLARRAVGDETDAARAALRIEAFVQDYVRQKALSIGMATAAETVRTREGDCTEHAILAAALARAAGMPSRIVDGLVYVSDWGGVGYAFAYHMWTEVWVGEWLPLDAALGGYDATHVALHRSDLNEPDALAGAAGIVPFFGRFKIRVLDVRHAGESEG